jgi:SAM-dependent methyltransferase
VPRNGVDVSSPDGGLIDHEVVTAWDRVALAYQQRYRIPTDEVHLGPMVPSPAELGIELPVAGRRVLDFGCGGGQNSVACARAGATAVVGIDPSRRQLELATALAAQVGVTIDLRHLDHRGLDALPADFDLVLSVYALQFVANVKAVFAELAARLRPGGLMIISVDHPVRLAGEWRGDDFVLAGYFARGWQRWSYDFPEAGLHVEMRRFRRSVSDWVNAMLAAPLQLQGLHEPPPVAASDTFGRRSKYGMDDPRNVFDHSRLRRVPGTLIMIAQRLG